MDSCYKLRQLFYYKVRHVLLQIATGVTKCDGFITIATGITKWDDYYKLRQYTRQLTPRKCSLCRSQVYFQKWVARASIFSEDLEDRSSPDGNIDDELHPAPTKTWTKRLYRFRVNCTCTYPVVNDHWGATDVASLPLHFILFSASLTASQNCNPVHSAKLFFQHFFCRSLLLPPCTVPYKIVLASPDDLDTCPNVHFNLRFFTVVKISS